jgi:TolB-like protein
VDEDDLPPSSFIDRMRRRKIVQWALAYAGGAWLLLQLLSLLAQTFGWPDIIMREAVVILAAGFLAVLVVAWFHGDKGHQRARAPEFLLLAALLALAATGFALVARKGDNGTSNGNPAGMIDSASIAVLPFDNLSSDPENEYFSDGITEDILNDLAKISGMRVIGRASVMQYKKSDKPISQIARELNVTHVLNGSVRRASNRIVISAHLLRAATGEQMWSDRYDGEMTDIFALQSGIASKIANALNTRLSPEDTRRLATEPTKSVEAYDLYMRGREAYLTWNTSAARKAVGLLRQAVRVDSQFGLAISLLSRAYTSLGSSDPIASDSARYFAALAIERSPSLPDAHAAMGEYLRTKGRYADALEHYSHALRLQPNHAWSIGETGEVLGPFGLGKLDQAIPYFERAITLDPATLFWHNDLTMSWQQLGDLKKAEEAITAGMQKSPGSSILAARRAAVAVESGDTATALRILEPYYRQVGRQRVLSYFPVVYTFIPYGQKEIAERYARLLPDSIFKIGYLYAENTMQLRAVRGEHSLAERAAEEVVAEKRRAITNGDQSASTRFSLAIASMVRGDRERALQFIEEYVKLGGRDENVLRLHLLLTPLQKDRRMIAAQESIRRDVAMQREKLDPMQGKQIR